MRRILLDIVECPSCGGRSLTLADPLDDGTEIRSAAIDCSGCGSSYPVDKGIAALLPVVMDSVNTEVDAWSGKIDLDEFDQTMHDTYRRMMLSLPDITSEFEPSDDARDLWRAIGDNFTRFALDRTVEGMVVLDVGAGRCWSSAALAARGASVVALDTLTKIYIGLETADIFIEEAGLFFERVRGDMHRLPFRDGTFDMVAESESAHHAADTRLFFSEVRRVLKRGGKFALVSEHLAWAGDEPPPEAAEGITERLIGLAEWFGLFRQAGLVPQECEVVYGRSFCCLLARKGDRPWPLQAARSLSCRLQAEANYRSWKLVALGRRVAARVPRVHPKSALRNLFVALGLPTSPSAFKPGTAYLNARLGRGGEVPSSLAPGLEQDSQWLGRGWYALDSRLSEPVRKAHRKADLVIRIPEGATDLNLKLGLVELYGFERPAEVTVRLDGVVLGTIGLDDEVETHRLEIPPGVGVKTARVSLEVGRTEKKPFAGRLGAGAPLCLVVERIEAAASPSA